MSPNEIESLDAESLKGLVRSLLGANDDLREQNDALQVKIAELLARIAELEGGAGKPPKTPKNSSVPPSRGQKANLPDKKNKRRRKGRPGVTRELCADPDVTRNIYVEGVDPADQVLAHAYDHVDMPPIKPVTTRINLFRAVIDGKAVTAAPPADMPPGSPFGPSIVALVTYLHGCHMVGYARLAGMLGDLFGLNISEGAIANIHRRSAVPFAKCADAIRETVRTSPVIASDETSARVKRKTWWQWVFRSTTAVYHVIAPTRGKIVPVEFLDGAKPDVWVSDRFGSQCGLALLHQLCLAHLGRDAQYAIDAGDDVFAPKFKAFLKRCCEIGQRRPDLSDTTIKEYARRLHRELAELLKLKPPNDVGRKLRHAMFIDCDKLLVFMTRRDVEPTNNGSEQALRPSVIHRKVTNCFRSEWAAKAYADLRSIIETGRLRAQTALTVIRAALSGSFVAA